MKVRGVVHLTAKNMKMVLEHDASETQARVGSRHGVTQPRVQVVMHARQHLDRLELDLLKATKTGEAIGLAIPHQDQEDRMIAMDYLDWIKTKLRECGVQLKVEHRPTHNGSVFFLTDITDYTPGGKS